MKKDTEKSLKNSLYLTLIIYFVYAIGGFICTIVYVANGASKENTHYVNVVYLIILVSLTISLAVICRRLINRFNKLKR